MASSSPIGASTMATGLDRILSKADLDAMTTMNDFKKRCKVKDETWSKFAAAVGDVDFDDAELLAAVSEPDFLEAMAQYKVGITQRAALTLLYSNVKAVFGVEQWLMGSRPIVSERPRIRVGRNLVEAKRPATICASRRG